MPRGELLRRRPLVVAALITGLAHLALQQLDRGARFELGEPGDVAYLADAGAFYPAQRMSGLVPQPDGGLAEGEFLVRLTRSRARLRLPYHLAGSGLQLHLRCDRFSLQGAVTLSVNGRALGDYAFDRASPPWGGIRALVPAELARRGPLEIELWTAGGRRPPESLPADLGIGLDWVEVSPVSRSGVRIPVAESWLRLALALVAGHLALVVLGARPAWRGRLLVAGGLVVVGAARLGGRGDGGLFLQAGLVLALLAALLLALRRLYAWRREVALRAATLLLASAFAFAVVEGFARFREAQLEALPRGEPETLDLLMPNPAGTGSYRLKPSLELHTRLGDQDVVIRTNSHGMHWREVSREPDPSRPRIAFLGDSFTFGSWASSVEMSLVGVAERRLSRRRVEALNFGVGGYGLADAELLLKEQVIDFAPRYVILVMFNGNDFRDTYLGLDKERLVDGVAVLDEEVLEAKVPRGFRQADTTTAQPSPAVGWRAGLRELATVRLLAPLLGLEPRWVEFAPNVRFVSYSFWSRIPYHPVALEARDATLAAIGRIRDFTRERGIGLGVVTLPTHDQVHARQRFGHDFDTALPQAWVHTWCRERGIPYLDLLPPLREHVLVTGERIYVPGDTHFDDTGHRLAGEAIGEWIDCCVAEE